MVMRGKPESEDRKRGCLWKYVFFTRAGGLHESAMAFAIDNPLVSRVCNIMRRVRPRAQ
jgi:hypothetical protein